MWLALILVSAAAHLGWIDATVGTYDEGLVLVGADHVLRGDIPYRDFWTLYGPGSFYALAALYALFGELVIVERAFDIAAKTAIAVLVFAVVLQFGRRTIALAAGLLSLGLLLCVRSYAVPLFPAVASLLAAVLALHHVSIDPRPAAAFAAGVAVRVTTWFRHDLGAYVLRASIVFLAHLGWAAGPGIQRRDRGAAARWFAGGLAVCVGPVIAFFVASVPACRSTSARGSPSPGGCPTTRARPVACVRHADRVRADASVRVRAVGPARKRRVGAVRNCQRGFVGDCVDCRGRACSNRPPVARLRAGPRDRRPCHRARGLGGVVVLAHAGPWSSPSRPLPLLVRAVGGSAVTAAAARVWRPIKP